MITEAGIRSALGTAPTSGKGSITLKDDSCRSEGRLTLIIPIAGERITPEWYSIWYRGETRRMAKLGTYPTRPRDPEHPAQHQPMISGPPATPEAHLNYELREEAPLVI